MFLYYNYIVLNFKIYTNLVYCLSCLSLETYDVDNKFQIEKKVELCLIVIKDNILLLTLELMKT